MTELSGYDFMRRMLDRFPNNAVDLIIDGSPTKGENEILELKAGMCLLEKDLKQGDKPVDLYWNIAREAIAMANGMGGLIVIGIDDQTKEHIPLETNDPRHVIAKKGLEAYLREEVIDRIFPPSRTWEGLKDRSSFECPVSAGEFFHVRSASYRGKPVATILVKPKPAGELIKVICTLNGKRSEKLPIRRKGEIGEAKLLEISEDFASYENGRHTRSETLGTCWARIAPGEPSGTATQPTTPFVAQDSGQASARPDRLISQLEGRERRTEFASGDKIDTYTVIRKLGAGGMGVVYEVEHPNLKVRRAIKVFSTDVEQSDILERRFLTEGRILARLNHPRLIRVHDLDASKRAGCLYYEMDLVLPSNKPDAKPQTLADFVGKVSDRRAAEIFADLCDVLDYLHSQDIIHRDIKLENVLLGLDGRPVLSDFGVVRIHDPELKKSVNYDVTFVRSATANAPELGTPHYLAPELSKPGAVATAQSDAYALGVLFYRLLTGEWPGTDIDVWLKGHNRYWRKLLKRLLASNPNERPKDLAKFSPTTRIKYPSLWRKTNIALSLFGAANLLLLPLAFLGNQDFEPDFCASEKTEASVEAIIPAAETKPSFQETRSARCEPQAAKARPSSRKDTVLAERDLRALNNFYLPEETRVFQYGNADTFKIKPDIDKIHRQIYGTWKETKELTNLGMQITEVITSRRDLVDKCAKIRQDATQQLNDIIASTDYKKALAFYTALNEEFNTCGFTSVPRPSFTPPGH